MPLLPTVVTSMELLSLETDDAGKKWYSTGKARQRSVIGIVDATGLIVAFCEMIGVWINLNKICRRARNLVYMS